jgi:hypothetical protein
MFSKQILGVCWVILTWPTWGAVTGRELPKQIYTESLSLPRDMKFPHFVARVVENYLIPLNASGWQNVGYTKRNVHVPRYHVSE